MMDKDTVSRVMSEMGKRGGKKGGKKGGRARMASLSSEERSALAKKAVGTRWKNAKKATKKKAAAKKDD